MNKEVAQKKVARIAQRFGIMLMLATLLTSLIVRVPVTLAERSTGRDADPSANALWTADQLASAGTDLIAPSPDDSSLRAEVTKAYGKLPLSFELNQGQTDSQVKFLSRGPGYQIFLTPTETVFKLRNADYGDDTIGVFRPSATTFFLTNDNDNPQANIVSPFGQAADLPVGGDWDGDGKDTVGTFRPSVGRFFLSNDNSAINLNIPFGVAADQPVAGDWDGKP